MAFSSYGMDAGFIPPPGIPLTPAAGPAKLAIMRTSWVLGPVALVGAALVIGCSGDRGAGAQAGPAGARPAAASSPAAAGAGDSPGASADPEPAASASAQGTCQKDRGCAANGALPACPAGVQVRALADVLAAGNRLLGKKVAVRGPLRHTAVACASGDCKGPCCHTCGAHLVLATRGGVPWPAGARDALMLDDATASLICTGDDSAVCCAPSRAAGEEVVAIGTLRQGGLAMSSPTRSLAGATLCAAPAAP